MHLHLYSKKLPLKKLEKNSEYHSEYVSLNKRGENSVLNSKRIYILFKLHGILIKIGHVLVDTQTHIHKCSINFKMENLFQPHFSNLST